MGGSKKRKLVVDSGESESIVDKSDMDISTKVAAAIASPSVVGVVSRNLPAEMIKFKTGSEVETYLEDTMEIVFWGCGTIIECEEDTVSHKYLSTIIIAASLFEHTNGVKPDKVKIQTDSPLQTATLRALDDVVSFRPERSFQLLTHSNLFKIFSGTKIISLGRTFSPHNHLLVSSRVFGTTSLNTGLDCDELYWLKDGDQGDMCGVPVINCSGEVIGIMFYDSPFLPINIVLRWWKHFKSCRQYRRPWLGVKVANLHSSRLDFLEDFMRKFPNINSGVVVTKASEDSSEIRSKDVIVECDGKKVCSILQLFDIIWDKVGESVEVIVLRASPECKKFKLSLSVGETTPEKFYKWPRTFWTILHGDEVPEQAQLSNI